MRRKYILTGLVLLLLILVWGLYLYNKPHRNTAGQQPDFSLTATGLYQAYQEDETAANKKFLNKVIVLRGSIADLQTGSGNNSILLDAASGGGVNCSFSGEASGALKGLKKGDTIGVKGRCTGMLMDVNLTDCVLEK
jgi:hypothetical protein